MYDAEKVIEKRIVLAHKYINDLNNPAIVRAREIEIKTLQTAPRDEQSLEKLLEKKRAQVAQIIDVIEAEPLYSEIEALEWLLPIVQLRDSYFRENDFV